MFSHVSTLSLGGPIKQFIVCIYGGLATCMPLLMKGRNDIVARHIPTSCKCSLGLYSLRGHA